MAKAKPRPVTEEVEDDEEPSEADLEGGRMPFLSHLAELRDRVRNAAIIFMIAFVVCWFFADDIFTWLKQPLIEVWKQHQDKLGSDPHLAFGRLTEPFWVDMSIGMVAGIFVSSPAIFYQLWRFIAPGLYKKERRVVMWFAFFSALMFCVGGLFCYEFVLGNLYGFLIGYGGADLQPVIMMSDYLDLTRDMMIAFGAVFELPLLIYFLALVGIVNHRMLWRFNRWFIVIAFVVGAILTPSPDAVSQIMMATPMVLLYNASILLAWRITVKRERKAAALQAKMDAESAPKKKKPKRRVVVVDDDGVEHDADE